MRRKRKTRHKNLSRNEIIKRGVDLLRYRKIEELGDGIYRIHKRAPSKKFQDVYVTNGIYKCTCEYCVNGRGRLCPHGAAIQEYLKRKTRTAIQIESTPIIIKEPKPTCRDCKGTNCRFREWMYNKRSTRPRYLCLDCNCKFVFAPGSKGKHYGEKVIGESLDNVMWGIRPE